ncbi:MAG: glycoside hydrolase family 25 protein [Ruminococcus sp.]|nr:glycoside hydrolase family 25 protein [Ruminococcus sp.]
MSIFNNADKHASEPKDKNENRVKLLIILASVLLVAVVMVITIIVASKNADNNEAEIPFVEHEIQLVKEDEYITVNDPSLGTIEIEAVEGFAKNTYINENFITDENGKMTYYIDNEVASVLGVDLSEYQGVVDFEKLKEQGISFVILRIGGRYYSEEGKMYMDTNFHQYYKYARDAGLKIGGYFFSQAKNAQEAIKEAEFVLDNIRGMKFDYPVAFDWELIEGDTARTDTVTGEQLTDAAIAFCDVIKEADYNPIIYTNTHLMYYKYDLERLKDYEFWIADYENHPSMYYHFTMWQYNIEGKLDGIQGNVDMNICMKNY